MVYNEKDQSKMLLADKDRNRMLQIQDNGGGMNPDKMRHCMSLGYSAKSKIANVIGQYGNGFKTSTMRLGADVIVFSMCREKDGKCATRSIGLLSYTFLTSTGKEDIVVPMFNSLGYQGTRIVIYNLWEDDEGQLELDFGIDPEDIQIRGVNRDEKKIAMAKKYPNSKHFLTYQHSLRSYASILYLRLPPGFRIILRGKDVEHHNLVHDMMHQKQVSYKPVPITDGTVKDSVALTENPFWRVWNAAGSDGRGVVGVLEANFVEPAHDKQSFEKTTALSRLEARLIVLQKTYWRDHCHEIGYAPRRQMNKAVTMVSPLSSKGNAIKGISANRIDGNTYYETTENGQRNSVKKANQSLPLIESSSEDEMPNHYESPLNKTQSYRPSSNKAEQINDNTSPEVKANILKLRKEIGELKNRLHEATEARNQSLQELQYERDRCKSFEAQLEEANKKNAQMDKEQEALIQIFAEERERRNIEEDTLRKRLHEASVTIEQLVDKDSAASIDKSRGRGKYIQQQP
ncbi:Protein MICRORCHIDIA 4 [Bienertia sinuspersici]